MESMPFLHAGRMFSVVFSEDLAFLEVRRILDDLLSENAFSPDVQERQRYYRIDVNGASFDVWVSEMEVIIKRIG